MVDLMVVIYRCYFCFMVFRDGLIWSKYNEEVNIFFKWFGRAWGVNLILFVKLDGNFIKNEILVFWILWEFEEIMGDSIVFWVVDFVWFIVLNRSIKWFLKSYWNEFFGSYLRRSYCNLSLLVW